MTEIAVVASRKARLEHRAQRGDAGARAALALVETPTRFLSTVQVGITLVGILAGAFGGATIARSLALRLREVEALARYSDTIALAVVVIAITYVSLVLGELVPKRLALSHAERIASLMGRPMRTLSVVAAPVIHVLSASTDLVMRLLRVRPPAEPAVTEDEIRRLIDQATAAGVFRPGERTLVDRVFRLGDRRITALMTPRPDIVWLDVHDAPQTVREKIAAADYSAFPVADGTLDRLLGMVRTRDLIEPLLAGQPLDLRQRLRPPLLLPEAIPALAALDRLKEARSHVALIVDEYGALQGLITLDDILEAIVGEMPTPGETPETPAVRRDDGSWLLDGLLPIDELKETLGLDRLPEEEAGGYQTLGGMVTTVLGHIPQAGERFDWGRWRFEVVDMDRHRVDKVLATPLPPEADGESAAG